MFRLDEIAKLKDDATQVLQHYTASHPALRQKQLGWLDDLIPKFEAFVKTMPSRWERPDINIGWAKALGYRVPYVRLTWLTSLYGADPLAQCNIFIDHDFGLSAVLNDSQRKDSNYLFKLDQWPSDVVEFLDNHFSANESENTSGRTSNEIHDLFVKAENKAQLKLTKLYEMLPVLKTFTFTTIRLEDGVTLTKWGKQPNDDPDLLRIQLNDDQQSYIEIQVAGIYARKVFSPQGLSEEDRFDLETKLQRFKERSNQYLEQRNSLIDQEQSRPTINKKD